MSEPKARWALSRRRTGEIIAEELEVADTFFKRFVGLQFRPELPPGRALLITPCSSIHTMWVKFPIDVVMLDRRGSVLAVHQGVRPWKFRFGPKGTHAVLELPAHTCPLGKDERLELRALDSDNPKPVPRSLQFLVG